MSYTPAVLTGHFEKLDGTAAEGRVEVIPNSKVIVDGAGNIVLAGRQKATLVNGAFSLSLPPTDDATLEPATNRQYTIVVRLNHANDVPTLTGITLAGGTTHDWADLVSGVEAVAAYSAFFNEQDLADLRTADTANASAISAEASSRVSGDAASVATAAADATSKVAAEVTARNTAIATAISNLVAGAPGALDTLLELANAESADATAIANLLSLVGTMRNLTDTTLLASLNAAFEALVKGVTTVAGNTAPTQNTWTKYDATAAARTPTLPALSGLAEGALFPVQKGDGSDNLVTLTCAGSDTFDGGATALTMRIPESRVLQVVVVGGTKFWKVAWGNTPISSLEGLPSYAGTRTRAFDKQLNIYGSKKARADVRRALGVSLGTAQSSLVHLHFIGDSLTAGYKATTLGVDDYVTLLTNLLRSAGYPITGGWDFFSNGTAQNPNTWTSTGAWAYDSTGNHKATVTSGVTATYTSRTAGTVLEFAGWTFAGTTQTVNYNLDGGAQTGTFAFTGGSVQKKTFTGLSNTTHTITITTTSTTLFGLLGATCRNTTGLAITNGGIGGSKTSDWLPTQKNTAGTGGTDISYLNPYKASQTIMGGAPRLAVVMLGGNDALNSGPTPATMKANLATIVSAYQTAGSTVLQRLYPYMNAAARVTITANQAAGVTWDNFLSNTYDVSDTYDTALVDHSYVLGDPETMESGGLTFTDHVHLLTPGQAAIARADHRALIGV